MSEQLNLFDQPAKKISTSLRLPADLPDRLAGSTIGIDLETEDKGLNSKQGPGWAWRDGGRVVGYSVAADNFKGYFPIGHSEDNYDPSQVRRWLNHVLKDERQTKVFANAMYDLGWAWRDGVKIAGPIVDIQLVEPLLDEHRYKYDLDTIAKSRIDKGKDQRLLERTALQLGVKSKKEIWKIPGRFVVPYATRDAELPREIWEVQKPLVEEEDLGGILALELDLLPMYVDMTRKGVRIDVPYAEQLKSRLEKEVQEIILEIRKEVGFEVKIWAGKSIARAFDEIGLEYGFTEKTRAPSINHDLLMKSNHKVARLILAAREADKLVGTFLEGQILGQLHEGRVHGQIHPLKSDEGGTITGRLSMSTPNLQFIPTRTETGRLIRRCFLPEEGSEWVSLDHSQQEPRLLIHFAVMSGMESAMEARDRFVEDPKTDFHQFVADLTGLERKPAKILNLAIIYGRGIRETSYELGKSMEETKKIFDQHARKMPFAREMSNKAQHIVRERGYLRTLLNRRQRFPLYEVASWEHRSGMYTYEEAKKKWPGQKLVRARTHKALNSLIQPSAADQMKKGMLDIWKAGFRNVMVQVHDELGCSVSDRKTIDQIAELMREAVKLEVPCAVDAKVGPNWGECE